MANLKLFKSKIDNKLPKAHAINEAGGIAYQFKSEHQLAQYAATGCLNGTYYASAEAQFNTVLALCKDVAPITIAKIAIYCREKGYMKDMPALLLAVLSLEESDYFSAAFPRVVNNGKMLRNFVQIMRSGAVGRMSLGSRPKKWVQNWLNNANEKALLAAAVGNSPSLADVVKMVHPKPAEAWREAFFAWLIGKPYNEEALPPLTKAFEAYKKQRKGEVPDVPFQMLTSLELGAEEWASIAKTGSWQMVRMNLNTFERHGVFNIRGMDKVVANKLQDVESIRRSNVFPYQLLTAYQAAKQTIPAKVRDALQEALEIALMNVPALNGRVVVCPDVSGSMHSPATGYREGATTVTRCIDVAGLIAATYMRKQSDTLVLPFERDVVSINLNSRDSVMTNAQKLASIGGGGTNCSAPLRWLNKRDERADIVILVSDNESWLDAPRYDHGATKTMSQWEIFKRNNPQAKLVCLDMQPYATTQVKENADILNIGGFSDAVFNMIAAFAEGEMKEDHWMGIINNVTLSQ